MDTRMHPEWREPAQLASNKFCEVQHWGLMVYIQSCERKELTFEESAFKRKLSIVIYVPVKAHMTIS